MEIIAKVEIPIVFQKMGEGKLLELFVFLPQETRRRLNLKRRQTLFCENKKRTLRFFHRRGVDCSDCGIKGAYFAFWRERQGERLNFSLFAEKNGIPVQMTIDHIIPKSHGGKRKTDINTCPMCFSCNNAKGNSFEFFYCVPKNSKIEVVEENENDYEFYFTGNTENSLENSQELVNI
jgi:hypothetical protein